MRIFMIVLMILVGVVFVIGPASLLTTITPSYFDFTFWIVIIVIYYVLATLVPIDKIIGKVYPIFGFFLLIMALGILFSIFYYQPELPEIWEGLQNRHPFASTTPIFPIMFVTIACGAVSGFHATQSPLMARCMKNEKLGRPIFFGAMITEGIVTLIWAAAATYFFHHTEAGKALFVSGNPTLVVNLITQTWMGKFGAVLAILGVVFAPISTGDTAFRMGRIMIAEFFHYDQKKLKNRLIISVPIFSVAILIMLWSINDKQGFDTLWRYFSWGNQFLACVTLWACSIYFVKEQKWYWVTLIPAVFMTMVCSLFIFIAQKEGFGLSPHLSYSLSSMITIGITIMFFYWKKKQKSEISIPL